MLNKSVNFPSVVKITIPQHDRRIKISEKQRPKFKTVTDKKTGEKVKKIVNMDAIDTPKYWVVNGQQFYSSMHPGMRITVMRKIKEYINPYLPKKLKVPEQWHGKIKIYLNFYDYLPKTGIWDCDNQWPWIKAFTDSIVAAGIIPDDSIEYVRSNGQVNFFPVTEEKDRKLEFCIECL